MSNHFVSINRGKTGMVASDFTAGSSSTAGDDIEIRIADGASLTRKDVMLALEAFEIYFGNKDLTTFPPL